MKKTMTIDTQALIEQRPHLKEPLELYAKWQRFHSEIGELLPQARSAISPMDAKGYPQESAGAVFRLFSSIFDLPAEDFEPLCQALENGAIDFMRFPLDEFPDFPTVPCSKEELTSILLPAGRQAVGEWPLSPLLGTLSTYLHRRRPCAPLTLFLLRNLRPVSIHRLSKL